MNLTRQKSTLSNRTEGSFIVSESEEEDYSPLKKNLTASAQVINESDPDGDSSLNSDSDESKDEKSATLDSEEEDRQFMNSSHMVSIIENSSDSESDSNEENQKFNNLKRRSIYDNPSSRTPKSESTPLHGIKRKRIKKAIIISSDSELENLADYNEKSTTKNGSKVLQYSIEEKTDKNESEETNNEFAYRNNVAQSEESNETSSNYQDLSEESKDSNVLKADRISNRTNSFAIESRGKDVSVKKRHTLFDDSDSAELPINKSIYNEKIISVVKEADVIDLTISSDQSNSSGKSYSKDKNTNMVGLTVNQNYGNKSDAIEKNTIKNNQESSDEILLCESTSTSENEIDDEVLQFVKKEIGVGNIDPLEAQKKEHFLLEIKKLEYQLTKLEKFISVTALDLLPDKGAKVYESIESIKKNLVIAKEKLAKLNRKSSMKNARNSQLTTIKPKPNINIQTTKPEFKKERESESYKNDDFEFQLPTIKPEPKINTQTTKSEVEKKKEPASYKSKSDDFDIHDIPNVPQTSFDTDDLGKKALATLNKQQTLTVQRLESLHGSLTSRPAEDAREKDPYGLKIPLMAHQQHALAWMKWRERQKPKGGILADDMGLGKTLTMIALVLANLNDEESDSDNSSSDDEWFSKKKHKRYYGGTLVVCPASLIKQWESEVNNRCKRGLLSVLVFHGNKRTVDDRKLSKYNIVITTYQTLVREAELESGMYKMEWNRVILDEAHYIRNHKSKACVAVCGLSSKYRWTLSGTPIQNKGFDLYAILKFLQCSPFDDLHVWKRWVENKSEAGKQRLITIMKTLMLRRTKQELQAKGALESLPEKLIDILEVEMDRDETLAYQKILLFSQNLFAQFLAQRAEKHHTRELYGGKFDKPSSYGAVTQFTKAQKALLDHHSNIESYEILVLLLRLRQMCCHPALIHAMLDNEDTEVNGILEQDDANSEILQRLSNMSMNDEDKEVDEVAANYKIDDKVATNLLTKNNPVFHENRRSSKVRQIIKIVKEIIDKDDKVVIVSQWSSFLKVIAKSLDNIEDAKYAFFTGEVPVKKRQDIVDKLNNPRDDTNILLLSLTAGGVGLNLVGANHLLLVDIHWNPQLEAQAQDRIYRFGQKKNVHVYKFICKESIEERVKALQDKKLEIANEVLTGTRTASSKLTIEDLKLLFS